MKKLVLATAVAALSVTAAQAAPTVYGKVFLTLDLKDGDKDVTVVNHTTGKSTTTSEDWSSEETRSQLNSNASRIGIRGSEALTANTDVVYQLEYGVDVDANTDQFYSRDTYLGLSNKQYGTLLAGRLKAIDGRVDYANVTEGGVMGGDNVLASFDAPRANNTFAYVAPTYNDVTVSAMYVMDENSDNVVTKNKVLDNNGNKIGYFETTKAGFDTFGRDAFGVAAQYEPNAPYRAGISYIQAGDALKAVRLSGAYDLSPTYTIGALYQNTDYDSDDKENAFTLSVSHKVAQTPWTTYGQVDLVDNLEGAKDSEAQRVVIGGKYAYNRATTGHIYGAYLNKEYSEVNSTANTTTTTETSGFGIGAGLEYKF